MKSLFLVGVCSFAVAVGADVSEAAPRTHDGFYLGLRLGPAYASADLGSVGVSLSDNTAPDGQGFGLGLTLQVGGALTDNLILFGELSSTAAVLNDDVIGSFASLGAGLAYYLPSNSYLSAGAGFTWQSFDSATTPIPGPTRELRSDLGVGGNAALGHEWWVGDEWALGLELRGFVTKNNISDTTDINISGGFVDFPHSQVTAMGLALSMSLTLN